jgi:menaquinone-dependent protoporphyrinogen oxidase
MDVLVGYATAHGSTEGIAQHIGAKLREHGFRVDVCSLDQQGDVGRYEAAVLGSAIHGGAWLPFGAEFIRRHAAALSRRPVWLFSVSTLGEESSAFRPRTARRLRAMRKNTTQLTAFRAAIRPRDHHDFAGVIQPEHWSVAGRAFMKAVRGRYGDHRNWSEIDRWAEGIARTLAAASSRTPPRE